MTLTKSDLDEIDRRLNQLESSLGNKLAEVLEEQEEKYEAKLTQFKSEFFEKIDPILEEVETSREERPLIENRLEAVEGKVGIHSS